MKILKKIGITISILGVMLILIFSLGTTASAETYGDLKYTVSNGKVTITGYNFDYYNYSNGYGELVIPKKINGYPVTAIGQNALSAYSFTNIIIPDSVTMIGDYAFAYCTELKKITIPDSVTKIGDYAFSSCASLTRVVIPKNVTKIGDGAFSSCRGLSKILVNENNKNYTNDEYGVLYNKDKSILVQYPAGSTRTEFVIPNSVKTIGASAFSYNFDLTEVIIPNSVTKINNLAFFECQNLDSITIYNKNCQIYDSETTIDSYAIIYGISGSTAQSYAKKYNRDFLEIKCSHSYKPTVVTKATLTKNGKVENKCSVCGKVSKTTTVYYPKTIALSATKFTYNGSVKGPGVTVKNSQGKALVKGTDYTVKYSDGRKSVGKYTVTVTFKGNYSGTKTLTFYILPGKTSKITPTATTTTLKATWNKVTGASGYKVELLNANGKVVKTATTKNLSYTFTKLSAGTTYKVRVTAYTTISGKNQYSVGSTNLTTATKPATPTLTLSSSVKGKANIKWSNVAGETGYQVYYATSKNGTYSKAGVYTANTVSGSKSKLTSGKTYYFKVRAYKKVGSTTVYGAWSSVKSVKIK